MKLELLGVEADEGVSGSVPPMDRPSLARAVALLAKGDVLLVAKRDRLGRDSLQVALLGLHVAKLGARIVSAAGEGTEDDSPQGRLMTRIIDAFAEYERDLIRDRTRRALGAKRARGERCGTVPYGWKLGEGGLLEEAWEERVAILLMTEHKAARRSLREIAATLTLRGYRPKKGRAWWASSVREVLSKHVRPVT